MLTKTSFIHILMHSFQFFQYYPDRETKLYTIVTYPELERDYYEFLKEFEMRPLPETMTTSVSPEIKDELQKFCEDVEQSTIFELIPASQGDSKLPLLRSSSITPSSTTTTVQLQPLMLGGEEKLVPMYPCQLGERGYDHFYLAYGFNEGYVFIFKDFQEAGLKVYGLVEPTPGIDPTYWNLRRLEKYFLHIHRTHEPKSRDFDPICSLNGYQQFRLCSLLENSRRLEDLSKSEATDKKINTESRHQRRCEENLKVTFEKIDTNGPAYSALKAVKVTAMPCHMNKNRFSFLVSHNPNDEQSVFILDRRVNWATGQKEGRVVQHVSDIALLKYANDLY